MALIERYRAVHYYTLCYKARMDPDWIVTPSRARARDRQGYSLES